MEKIGIFLHRGKSTISRLIRWQTYAGKDGYSHASIMLDGARLIESREFKGVGIVPFPEDEDMDLFIVEVTEYQKHKIIDFAESQLGKKYDYGSIWGFLKRSSKESRKSSGKWFCSEFVFACFQKADVNLLERIEAWKVTPEMLSYSPLLKK